MKKNIVSAPEDFSLSPLLALLPSVGKVSKLSDMTASFYARYEKVTGLLREVGDGSAGEIRKRLLAEQQMLQVVLEWLEVSTEEVE